MDTAIELPGVLVPEDMAHSGQEGPARHPSFVKVADQQTPPRITLQALQAYQVSQDEDALLLLALQHSSSELVISVPFGQLFKLIDLTAAGRIALRKLAGADSNRREAHLVSQWEWSKDMQTGKVYLSLTFGAGGRLDFRLPDAMAESMLEGLQVLMEQTSAAPDGTIFS